MQQTVAELQDQQANNQSSSSSNTGSTESFTGSTESGTVIINNYYTISSTGSTESGFTNHSGYLEWTHSETILAELLGNIGSTGSTNSGNIITPRDAILYISRLFTNMTDVVHNFVALEITAVHGYFNEIWTDKVNTKELCIKKSDGTNICLNGDQLESILGTTTSSPQLSSAPDTTEYTDTSSGTIENNITTDTGSVSFNTGSV